MRMIVGHNEMWVAFCMEERLERLVARQGLETGSAQLQSLTLVHCTL